MPHSPHFQEQSPGATPTPLPGTGSWYHTHPPLPGIGSRCLTHPTSRYRLVVPHPPQPSDIGSKSSTHQTPGICHTQHTSRSTPPPVSRYRVQVPHPLHFLVQSPSASATPTQTSRYRLQVSNTNSRYMPQPPPPPSLQYVPSVPHTRLQIFAQSPHLQV